MLIIIFQKIQMINDLRANMFVRINILDLKRKKVN